MTGSRQRRSASQQQHQHQAQRLCSAAARHDWPSFISQDLYVHGAETWEILEASSYRQSLFRSVYAPCPSHLPCHCGRYPGNTSMPTCCPSTSPRSARNGAAFGTSARRLSEPTSRVLENGNWSRKLLQTRTERVGSWTRQRGLIGFTNVAPRSPSLPCTTDHSSEHAVFFTGDLLSVRKMLTAAQTSAYGDNVRARLRFVASL